MKIIIVSSTQQMTQLGADMFTQVLGEKPNAVLGLATGSSPLPVYQELISRHKKGAVSFKDARAFLLDEYAGLSADHPEGYRNFIKREFASGVDFQEGAVQGPMGDADDVYQAARDYEESIVASGGVDLQILGIGTDGHIGFNEPGGSLSSPSHVEYLTEQTRIDNARFFDNDFNQVPTRAITQGLATISRAKKIVLVAQGAQKSQAVAQMIEGGVSALWPASILQFHNDATILLDEAAASQLQNTAFYRAIAEAEALLN